MASNGDTLQRFPVDGGTVVGIGSFHKTLPHNQFGEVLETEFMEFVAACDGDGRGFNGVQCGTPTAAPLVNPQCGLAADGLIAHPAAYTMPPAPTVLSDSTAAEMTELYWMALLRDLPFNEWAACKDVADAAACLNTAFGRATADTSDPGHLRTGRDLPGAAGAPSAITAANVFRMGFPGETDGPMVSQFFVRPVAYGTQTIDQKQCPYVARRDYLTQFPEWLSAQNAGRDNRMTLKDRDGQPYPRANEDDEANFDPGGERYISTMRDLARFVHKDALHQAYFNAALLLLSGDAAWNPGNPYRMGGPLERREASFGVLGGPHILALVSEVATRALKVVWHQKWQVHLRLRPEAFGGLAHVQSVGVNRVTRPYGLPDWFFRTDAATRLMAAHNGLLLPMAFTSGSPVHPAYGAGHATVAGACVTVLKAFFKTMDRATPIKLNTLLERDRPWGPKVPMSAWLTGSEAGVWKRLALSPEETDGLTIEGELNKLAHNVAMGRTMGGVHWRSDNTRSILLGEAIAAAMLAEITCDVNENPSFEFRSFARGACGQPRCVDVRGGRVYVDGVLRSSHFSEL